MLTSGDGSDPIPDQAGGNLFQTVEKMASGPNSFFENKLID